ncbi:MAG: tRNA (N6-isopentenyl adenosine(37)-C2)-methylthiotransferase MiaB [Spirochaetales bacterium]|nr:tRNA (N6-isopentenyl adenosine(37)-C2)-methylthiotransferase MiaB [Spirochaetales bacterium]
MPGKYWLETYGCQMNFAESNAIEIEFVSAGFIPALNPEEADIAVLNTCSVRQTAENRIWGRLGYFQHLKDNKEITVILTGCMAERLSEDIKKKSPAVDYVVGTNDKQRIIEVVQGISRASEEYSFKSSYEGKSNSKSLLPIMNGCDNFCSYCIVPYVRGREISRDPDDILKEIAVLQEHGIKEVTLLGQNVNSYRFQKKDKMYTFPMLLRLISDAMPENSWIRFLSPHPKDFSDELINLIADRNNICSHIHLPVQSGSNSILKTMKRNYTREKYVDLIKRMRRADASITFSTDILVGFPGESEEDFKKTLSLVDEVEFLDAFMYYFNPREGTEAMNLPDHLDNETKLYRLQQLIDFQRKRSRELKQSRLTRTERVLCEGVSKKDKLAMLSRTEHDEIVIIKDSSVLIDYFIDVTITHLVGNTYMGEVVCPGKRY